MRMIDERQFALAQLLCLICQLFTVTCSARQHGYNDGSFCSNSWFEYLVMVRGGSSHSFDNTVDSSSIYSRKRRSVAFPPNYFESDTNNNKYNYNEGNYDGKHNMWDSTRTISARIGTDNFRRMGASRFDFPDTHPSFDQEQDTDPYSDQDQDSDTDPYSPYPPAFPGEEQDEDVIFDDGQSSDVGNSFRPFFPSWRPAGLGSHRFDTSAFPTHSPVKYKYYGRRRAHKASIPFILLGPNVDHWKVTAQQLASRGFNVIVCERATGPDAAAADSESDADAYSTKKINKNENENEGYNLVLGLLEALRWNKAVLVGCDNEAVLAIQAALQLAPDRVAGLVLCGNLSDVNQLVVNTNNIDSTPARNPGTASFAVDTFLKEYLPCPFSIVWDGEAPTTAYTATSQPPSHLDFSPLAKALGGNRSLIIGGGSAPHRKRPEQLTWVLTRFVEDKVAGKITLINNHNNKVRAQNDLAKLTKPSSIISKAMDEMFPSGSVVVFGRVAASILFYITLIKVGIYQYDNVRCGMGRVKSVSEILASLPRRVVGGVSSFIVNYGYISRIVKRKSSRETEDVFEGRTTESETETKNESETEEIKPEPVEEAASENETEEPEEAEAAEEEKEFIPLEKGKNKRFQPTFFLDHVVA